MHPRPKEEDILPHARRKVVLPPRRNSNKFHFDEDKAVPFDKFTRSDRQELISSILGNDYLLGQFYAFMVDAKGREKESTFMRLQGSKTAFSDKIFKIKLCGVGK